MYNSYVRDNEMAERLQVPGTGLGLSIASSLVRKMGRKLTFHSAVGLGTDFYVSCIALSLTGFFPPFLQQLYFTEYLTDGWCDTDGYHVPYFLV